MNSDEQDVFHESSVGFDPGRIRAAVVYCSAGRFGEQVDDLLQNALHLPRYDRLAVSGGAACIASHLSTDYEEESVREQLHFLIAVHRPERVVLVAHAYCAFYLERLQVSPLELKAQQLRDMQKAAERIRSLFHELIVEVFSARTHGDRVIQFDRVQ